MYGASQQRDLIAGKKSNTYNKNNIKIFHQNIEHLESRKEALEVVLCEENPDIIILSEHAIKNDLIDRINIEGYYLNNYYCRDSTVKGGVLIMSKNQMKYKQVSCLAITNICEDRVFEFCAVKYQAGDYEFIIAAVYRSPSSNSFVFIDRLSFALEELSKICKNIIVAGDLNINVLSKDREQKELRDMLRSHNMFYLVDFPTRVARQSKTAIDNFLTNISKDQLKVYGLVTCLSDHDGQVLEVSVKNVATVTKSVTFSCHNFSKNNVKTFRENLAKENWTDVFYATTDTKYTIFNNIMTQYFYTAFPKKKKQKIRL